MLKHNLFYLDKTAYAPALEFQTSLFEQNLNNKAADKPTNDYLIFLQHFPVYTIGKSGNPENLKVPVEKIGAEYFKTNRGGDITYHGPGQLTGYPIFDLDHFNMGIRQYVECLEDCIIDFLKEYDISGERLEGCSGVWIDTNGEKARKICAIGIKVSRGICMHGFALNINTDLKYFENIVPCGISDKGVTSIQAELGRKINFTEAAEKLYESFNRHFVKKS